jgi:hypothetical protein
MEDELRMRFYRKKLEDFLNDNIKPFPTMIMEMVDPKFLELFRPYILCGNLKPYRGADINQLTREGLELMKIKDYGNLYILVNPN